MFYQRPVRLDRSRHLGLRLRPQTDFSFAARTNTVIVTGAELAEAQRAYPIAFIEVAPRRFFPAALLGLRAEQNLFLDADGRWEAGTYVPAFVRRYPFVLTPELDVCIDEQSATFDREEGEPLFNADGSNAPALDRAAAFLHAFHQDAERTQALCDELRDLDLLKPWTVMVTPERAEPYRINGLHVLDDARLAALPDSRIAEWFRSGDLARLQAQMLSLQNLPALARRLTPVRAEPVAVVNNDSLDIPSSPSTSVPERSREKTRRRARAQ